MALYVALYDVKKGGAARGFQCQFGEWSNRTFHDQSGVQSCNRVTRTERGMQTHLWRVHHVKVQIEMFTDREIKPTPALQALCDPPKNQTARTCNKTL